METLRMRRGFVLCDMCFNGSLAGSGNTTIFAPVVFVLKMVIFPEKASTWIDSKSRSRVSDVRVKIFRARDGVGVRTATHMALSRSLSLYTNLMSTSQRLGDTKLEGHQSIECYLV
jgi:hypothetical protein